MTTEEFKNRMIPWARKLYPMIKRMLGNDEEVKDALQELMVRFWNKKESLESLQNPDGYIITVARNYCIDVLKKPRIRLSNHPDEMKLFLSAKNESFEAREKLEHVHRIMEKLPEKQKEILQMREIDGFSFEEISQLTGLEIPHIRVLLSRSRVKVREEMEKIYSYERGTCQSVG